MPQSLTQIKALLAARGLRPKHRFGQNFLHDQNKIRRIVEAARVTADDAVLEVGSGTGTLTLALLEAGARVVAVEIDRDLCDILREVFADHGDRVTLIEGDVLDGKHAINCHVIEAIESAMGEVETLIPALSQREREKTFKLIANLPYNIASPLLINLALDHPSMSTAVIMIQKEVADRLLATPADGKAYGPLGIIMQTMCMIERITTLPPACFWPKPRVNSTVIKLTRREQPLTDDPHGFAAFMHHLFRHRRKQVRAMIESEDELPAFDWFKPTMRAEQFTVPQLIDLFAWRRNKSHG